MDNDLTQDIIDGIKYAIIDNSYIEAEYDDTVLFPDVEKVYTINRTALAIECTNGQMFSVKITEM